MRLRPGEHGLASCCFVVEAYRKGIPRHQQNCLENAISSDTSEILQAPSVGPSLRSVILRGSFWSLLGFTLLQGLRLASNLVLTRLLSPDVFGLTALISLFITGLEMLSDMGIGPCIIQNSRGDERPFLDTAFSIQVLRGLSLWFVGCLLAYPFSLAYSEPRLAYLIPVAGLSAVIGGLSSTSVWSLTRHVQIGGVTALRLGAGFAGVLVTIVWALLSPTIWAIVGGNLMTAMCTSLGSHFLEPAGNRLKWDMDSARVIKDFGKVILFSSATWFLAGQAERLILGTFISLTQLGIFSIALLLSSFASSALQEIANRVLFPTVASSLRHGREFALTYHKQVRLVAMALALMMGFVLIGGGKIIVSLILDKRYSEAGWMVQVLAIRAVVDVVCLPNTNLLMADARLRYFPYGNIARFVMITVGTLVSFQYGSLYAAVCVLSLASIPSYVAVLWGIRNHFSELFFRELAIAITVVSLIGTSLCLIHT